MYASSAASTHPWRLLTVLGLAALWGGASSRLLRQRAPAAAAGRRLTASGASNCADVPIILLDDTNTMYREVHEAYAHGLASLGHAVEHREIVNCVFNFVRGGQPVARACALQYNLTTAADSPAAVYLFSTYCSSYHERYDRLPPATVLLQLEPVQLWEGRPCCDNRTYLAGLQGKAVWDYDALNLNHFYRRLGMKGELYEHLPLFAYPGITDGDYSSPAAASEAGRDVDVLFLGGVEERSCLRRKVVLDSLAAAGVRVEILHFGRTDVDSFSKAGRESYLRRAKVVLNMHRADIGEELEEYYGQIPLEVVRLQYVLAAHTFVISEDANAAATRPYREAGAVVFAPFSQLAATVVEWLGRPADRHAVSDRGYSFIYSRGMSEVLRAPMQRAIQHLHGLTCDYTNATAIDDGGRPRAGQRVQAHAVSAEQGTQRVGWPYTVFSSLLYSQQQPAAQ